MTKPMIEWRAAHHSFWAAGLLAALLTNTSGALADTCNPTPQPGCMGNPPPCNIVNYFDKGTDTYTASPWPQEVAANISAFNPYPVWSNSVAFDSLEHLNTSPGGIAQLGYDHWYGCQYGVCSDGQEHVFVQWTYNNGSFSPIKFFNLPQSVENYWVSRIITAPNQAAGFIMQWNEGSFTTPSTVTWGPDTIDFAGEVLDYDGNTGSHVVGNQTFHVTVRNAQWQDEHGVAHTPNLFYYAANQLAGGPSTWYQYLQKIDGNNFDIWDNRCY